MTLKEILQLNDLNPSPYSGRGAHGKECVSFTVLDYFSLYAALVELGISASEDEDDKDMMRKAASNMRTEQAGRNIIAYFPSYPWHQEAA